MTNAIPANKMKPYTNAVLWIFMMLSIRSKSRGNSIGSVACTGIPCLVQLSCGNIHLTSPHRNRLRDSLQMRASAIVHSVHRPWSQARVPVPQPRTATISTEGGSSALIAARVMRGESPALFPYQGMTKTCLLVNRRPPKLWGCAERNESRAFCLRPSLFCDLTAARDGE
jgi:hypothetical protein